MRKWIALVLASFVTVLGLSLLRPMGEQAAVAIDETPSHHSYAQQMMQMHEGDRPISTGAVAMSPSVPVTGERVTYGTLDGKPIQGYLAKPVDATEPLPALIVIHEWWGLNENIELMTQRLAGEGYAALAVDLYEGEVAQDPTRARELVQAATQNPARLEENLTLAYNYLETEQQAPMIGSIGWCFGGSWSLNTALLFPESLDAAVIYYGGQLITDGDRLSALQMPVLGIFGELDTNPPPERVRTFEATMQSLDKTVEVYLYEGADHAFANPSGTRYNAEAAEDAWVKTVEFLNRYLKPAAV